MKRLLSIFLIWLACCGFMQSSQKPIFGSTLKNIPICDRMRAYWLLNEGYGDKILDIRNKIINSAKSNASWLAGDKGYALNFNGNNSYVKITNTSRLVGIVPITISFWAKFNTATTGDWVIGDPNASGGWWIYIVDGLSQGIRFVKELPDPDLYCSYLNVVKLSKWAHYVFIWDGGSNASATSMRLYIDGVLKTPSANTTNANSRADTGIVYFGYTSGAFDGLLDQVGIWNRVLTIEEIQWLYYNRYGLVSTRLSYPYLNFGQTGTPPAAAPTRRPSQVLIQTSAIDNMLATLFPWSEK